MLIFLSLFKGLFDGVIAFFNTKLGMIVGLTLIVLVSLYFADKHGFNQGVKHQIDLDNQKLALVFKEEVKQQAIETVKAQEVAKKEVQIQKVYVENRVEVEKIVEKYVNCKMSDEDFTAYKYKLGLIK